MSMFTALLTVTVLLSGARVEDVPNPRAAQSWVSDTAHVLDGAAVRRLNQSLDALERDLGVEVAVVTVPSVSGTPKEFATALFQRWGIGKAGTNNGLLVLLVMDRRRLEMETGYGLEEMLPDGWLGVMQNDVMVPRFKKGDFAEGLLAGVERVGERLRSRTPTPRVRPVTVFQAKEEDSPPPPAPALGAAPLHDPVPFQARLRAPPRTGRPSHTSGFGLAFVIFLGVFFIILAAVVTFLIKGGRKVRRWASEQATGQDGSSSDGFFQTSASSVMDDQPSRLHTTPDTATTHMTSNTESLASSSFASDSLSSASSATSFSDNSSSSPADSMSSGSSSSSADTTSSSSDFGGGSSGGGGSGSDW